MASKEPLEKSREKPDEQEVQRLVAACQSGDVEAFGPLYDMYIDQIYRYVFYRVDNEEAEDIVENIFVRVWEKIDKYVPGQHPFSSWMFRIAHNMVVDHYRRHRKHVSLRERLPKHVNQSSDDPVDFAQSKLTQGYVREALSELKDDYQQVLILKYLSGFDNNEIAQIMGKKPGNVRILQYRALKSLRQVMETRGINSNT